jgi:hypothetical protein
MGEVAEALNVRTRGVHQSAGAPLRGPAEVVPARRRRHRLRNAHDVHLRFAAEQLGQHEAGAQGDAEGLHRLGADPLAQLVAVLANLLAALGLGRHQALAGRTQALLELVDRLVRHRGHAVDALAQVGVRRVLRWRGHGRAARGQEHRRGLGQGSRSGRVVGGLDDHGSSCGRVKGSGAAGSAPC